MNIRLNYTGTVDVYDINTTYAASTKAPGLQHLCRWATTQNGEIDETSIRQAYPQVSAGAARNLFENGILSGVWTREGSLTDEGHETATTGEVMLKEVGLLRIWVFEHPSTGPVLLHADRLNGLPTGDATPQVDNAPEVLSRISQNRASTSLLSSEKKRWRVHWERGAWASVEKYKSRAELQWKWSLNDEKKWHAEPTLSLRGTFMGTNKNKEQDGESFLTSCDKTSEFEPGECIPTWLSQGRFSKSQWDLGLYGMRRRFDELTTAERHRWSIHVGLEPHETGHWAGEVFIDDMQLFAYNSEDAAHWIQYLIREHVKGYTTAETVKQLLNEFTTAPPFSWLADKKISNQVHKLLESSRADQRLSKLLSASDDLGSMAYIPEAANRRRGASTHIIHDGSDHFTPFVLALTQDLGGRVKRITVVDRYIHRDKPIKKFGAFAAACKELDNGLSVRLLTSEIPYRQMSTDYTEEEARTKYIGKLKPYCDELLLMEATKGAKAPHDRYIIVESTSETRFFAGTNTLFQGDVEKRFINIDRVLEPDLFKHLEKSTNKEEKA